MNRDTLRHPEVVGRDDSATLLFGDALMTIKARAGHGRPALIEWISPAGGTAPLHVHDDADDTFYVIDGDLTLWCDGTTAQARPGDYVVLPAGVPHSILVGRDRPLRALVIHANNQFVDLVEAIGAPPDAPRDTQPFDPQAVAVAASRRGQRVLGPSPFAAG